MSKRRQLPRVGSKCQDHQYTTTNRRAKHPPLVSNSPNPTYDPTKIPIGSRNVRTKCELSEIKGGDKREHTINSQTVQAKLVVARVCTRKMSIQSWITC